MSSTVSAPTRVAAEARFFRVLGDPTRIRILEFLADGPGTVSELVEATNQSQPRVSTHLACLRHCGFVETERRGKQVMYRLGLDGLDGLLNRAVAAMSPIAERLETCSRIGPDWV